MSIPNNKLGFVCVPPSVSESEMDAWVFSKITKFQFQDHVIGKVVAPCDCVGQKAREYAEETIGRRYHNRKRYYEAIKREAGATLSFQQFEARIVAEKEEAEKTHFMYGKAAKSCSVCHGSGEETKNKTERRGYFTMGSLNVAFQETGKSWVAIDEARRDLELTPEFVIEGDQFNIAVDGQEESEEWNRQAWDMIDRADVSRLYLTSIYL